MDLNRVARYNQEILVSVACHKFFLKNFFLKKLHWMYFIFLNVLSIFAFKLCSLDASFTGHLLQKSSQGCQHPAILAGMASDVRCPVYITAHLWKLYVCLNVFLWVFIILNLMKSGLYWDKQNFFSLLSFRSRSVSVLKISMNLDQTWVCVKVADICFAAALALKLSWIFFALSMLFLQLKVLHFVSSLSVMLDKFNYEFLLLLHYLLIYVYFSCGMCSYLNSKPA